MRIAVLSDLGGAPSALGQAAKSYVLAKIMDVYRRPISNVEVSAYSQGFELVSAVTNNDGIVALELDEDPGTSVDLMPKTRFWKKTVPYAKTVVSKKTIDNADAYTFRLQDKGLQDYIDRYVTMTNVIVAGVVGYALYYFLKKGE